MDSEHGLLVQILRDLAAREARWNEEGDPNAEVRAIYQYLAAHGFRRITEDEIESIVAAQPHVGSLDAWGGFIFLIPCQTKEWAVPVLTLVYQFDAPAGIAIRVGLFLVDSRDGSIGCVGYRLESPDRDGAHPYFHLQHIIELGNGAYELPTPPWMPQTKLAVPLDVGSDVGLLLCLLVSLYGSTSDVLRQILNSSYRTHVGPFVEQARWGADLRH